MEMDAACMSTSRSGALVSTTKAHSTTLTAALATLTMEETDSETELSLC